MDAPKQTPGIACLCDIQGIILKVLRDELGLTEKLVPGQPLEQIIAQGSRCKAVDFLQELRREN